MYNYDEEVETTRKERALNLLSALFYVFGVIALLSDGLLHGEIHPGWVIIPLSLFTIANFLKPVVVKKSWKSLGAFVIAMYLCIALVLGVFRPEISDRIVAIVGSLLTWLFIIAVLIGLARLIKMKVKRIHTY